MTPRLFAIVLLLCISLCPQSRALASDTDTDTTEASAASEYRQFTDKRGQQVEARIVSISDGLRLLHLESRNGQDFELPITGLSLDDQQFLRQWLNPSSSPATPESAVKVFGVLADQKPIHVDALEEVTDLVSIHAHENGWLALRESGEVLSFEDRYADAKLRDVARLSVNTAWIYIVHSNGTVDWITGMLHSQDSISDAVQSSGGNGHSAVLLRDGTVKAWGRDYAPKRPLKLTDPPQPLSDIIQLAGIREQMAALRNDGRVFCWTSGKSAIFDAMLGDGVVELDGGVFHYIALTRSGDVYTWYKADVTTARIPEVLKGKGEVFQKVRCNGGAFAAQKEDGSWIAWGKNHAGIVDHINSLGPVAELDFFSLPRSEDIGYVIWQE